MNFSSARLYMQSQCIIKKKKTTTFMSYNVSIFLFEGYFDFFNVHKYIE